MRNFDRDNRGGPRRDFGGGYNPERSRMGGGKREMFKAVCSNCGKECEVPFRPTGSKPVFCSDCFEKQGGGQGSERIYGERSRTSRGGFSSDRGPRRPWAPPSQPQNKEQFDALNAKLDKILAMLTPQVTPIAVEKKVKVSKKITSASEE